MRGSFKLIEVAAVAFFLFLSTSGCKDASPKEKQQTETDWINGQFGDPAKPRIFSSEDVFESIDDVGPSYLVVTNFKPKSGPRLFESGLFISVVEPPNPFPSLPSGSLDEARLSQYGRMIGKNSCGQTLFRVIKHTEFAREVTARDRLADDKRFLVYVVPDSSTLISCLNPYGQVGCSAYYQRKAVSAFLVIPSENVCSWPKIRQQLQEAIDGGLVPQRIREEKPRDVENAK